MPFATSKDQKLNTNQFLLFLAALSIWTFKMGSNGVAGMVFWTMVAMLQHTFPLH
jgi:hypothetical protein